MTRKRVTAGEQTQRHEWAIRQIDAGIGLSELTAPACAVSPQVFFQNFLEYGGFPAISTLISLQMFIHAPNPKFTPLGPSINS